MSDNKDVNDPSKRGHSEISSTTTAVSPTDVSSITGSVKTAKTQSRVSSSSDRQIKFERAQKCLENAALVSKRIKEHRKATAELLGRPFEDDDGGDTASEMASTMSERTGYSAATDTSTPLSVQDALNIPGISESLANTLKQKELLMERIKQYKEISKRPMKTSRATKKELPDPDVDLKKVKDNSDKILASTLKDKESALSMMQIKMKTMENTILDLQEKLNEKDQIIEAKNRATTLMSDSLSKKEKDSLLLFEDTRQQMIKMQENFINMETEWKEEKERLFKKIKEKDEKIKNLEEANTVLENARFEISVGHSKLVDELELKNKEILLLQDKIDLLSQADIQRLSRKEKQDVDEEKGSIEISNMVELTKKIELLEQINCQIRQTNKELENKLVTMNTESKSTPTSSPSKKGSPLPTRKGGRNAATKMKSPWSHLSADALNQEGEKKPNKSDINKLEMLVQSLNKDILDKEYLISQKDSIISELQNSNTQKEIAIEELKSNLKMTVMLDKGTCPATSESSSPALDAECIVGVGNQEFTSVDRKEFEDKLRAAQQQILALNEEIDAANKNMIKVKSNHKLKLRQMQKTIDNFSKVSDANTEIVKLNEEMHQLSQKVAELEEEKGNLQLHLVDYDSGRLTESDVYKKLVQMENLAEARHKAISVLEAQKFDLVQELHELQQTNVEMEDKLADMSQLQSEQVCTEIKSVQLEEQIDQLTASKKENELIIENLKLDKDHLNGTIKDLEEEKDELLHKLENYIQENMDLTDKFEKLSAEKVSSAESIEIVESLTKLEIEEYNKGMGQNKMEQSESYKLPGSQDSIEKLMEQSADLNKKIELFTQERQEVMEKMSKINFENESLHEKISEITNKCSSLLNNIELLNNEKHELTKLNEDLGRQIEDLKRERIEIMKESVEITKPVSVEDVIESAAAETHHEDKTGDKGNNRIKSVKQLTKEILKLKNTIKEREAEIGDCQMKILSLEERQQKQNELMQSNVSYEAKVKTLTDENCQLKEVLELAKKDKDSEQQVAQFKQASDFMQQELQKLRQEYTATINSRDARIHELEKVLVEYEKQIFNNGNILQQKDKEMSEYINQITKLNDVSQKLKSTIEVLEEEKAKDKNAELVKSLNKQISAYQKKLSDCEEKLKILDEEKAQLLSLKAALENKNVNLDTELQKMQDTFAEKQSVIKELQAFQQKHAEETSNVMLQVKERDEEIHEIKLQLRKESIENEKLRTSLSEKDNSTLEFTREYEEIKQNLNKRSIENEELRGQHGTMEIKNKELMEKLKKFAVSIKKKSSMYNELLSQLMDTQKQVETLQEKLKCAEEELIRIRSNNLISEQQKSQNMLHLETLTKTLEEKLALAMEDLTKLNVSYSHLQKESQHAQNENSNLKLQIDTLNNKIADYEIEQKNNMNIITKISSLETDINLKQNHITELINKLENQEQQFNQLKFGHEAKVQERDLYIESLEGEINKFKNRIYRLEESVSVMEDRRHSLERKADQLDGQLQEKQKAYSEYTTQEDQLVSRLAVLMDHDRVVEKQLNEIESENKELQYKIQHFSEENQRLRKSLSDIQDYCNTLVDKASKADLAESEIAKYQIQLREVETQWKRITHEYQTLITQKKQDIDELESEFNTQIENAIKEKKVLSEKYEKINEHVTILEHKLQEYRNNIENLNINIEELTRMNQDLVERSVSKEQTQSPDYTEQYINEINKLNSVINNRNQEIYDLNNKIHAVEINNSSLLSNQESKLSELNIQLQEASTKLELQVQESDNLRLNNEHMQLLLSEQDDKIRQLMDKKTMTFEMNIPKTEGMIISSKIEPFNEAQKIMDIASIESQILSDVDPKSGNKTVEQKQESTNKQTSSDGVVEEAIVPKKTYLCYKGEEPGPPEDPFNSDEGWGLGECEEVGEVTPGLSYLSEQIQRLKKENEELKAELDSNNNKLLKALKKLKELKSNNEMLSNELNISKQLSQATFLDSAIEDEMKINIQKLEKKIEELTADINKEKREKDALRKQNEVFNSANDRLTDMKEKLENEIELWKCKFIEANDKISTIQWGADSKDSSADHKLTSTGLNEKDSMFKDEIMKLEKENDELQLVIDQLTLQNKELSSQQLQLKTEINNLSIQMQQNIDNKELAIDQLTAQNKELSSQQVQLNSEIKTLHMQSQQLNNYEKLNSSFIQLQKCNAELIADKNSVAERLNDMNVIHNESLQQYEKLLAEKDEINSELLVKRKELIDTTTKFEEEIQALRLLESENKNRISSLLSELDMAKSQLLWHNEQQTIHKSHQDSLVLIEKFSAMEEHCTQMKHTLDNSNSKILQLETENQEYLQRLKAYEEQITELNAKMEHLNKENDQLLSTVAELRSSMSSAVDQRGFEIAELWKQHLGQREVDFQKTEQELKSQLSAFEAKYEQLLDNVQSSSQEETNQLIMMEQVTSLQNKLQDKEDHLRNLQDKYAEVVNQIDMLRSEIEDEKMILENKLLGQQEDYEKQIEELVTKNQHHSDEYEQAYKGLQIELAETKTYNDTLNQHTQSLLNKVEEFEENILRLTNELRLKDKDINQKTHDCSIALAQKNDEIENVQKQLVDYEKKLEDLNYEKESELAVLRLKMHEKQVHCEKSVSELETEKSTLITTLNAKIAECTGLNKQISELSKILQEHATNVTEMQTALENQEMEIVTLKDEISHLTELLRSSNSKIEKHVTFASDTKPGSERETSETMLNKELLDAVPRAELDLALYMLHQRDVRCEELTMELTQLLEERDTLQLRLSDSLRSFEDLKSTCKAAGVDVSISSNQETLSELPSFNVEREQQFVDIHKGPSSRSSSISDPDGDKPKLQAKLSELRSVKHSRDVRLRYESEQRDMDLRLLHRDVANLPPEAVEQLTQAHHTLSRDSQSTSTVLLNWLRGKSTPKVVHM